MESWKELDIAIQELEFDDNLLRVRLDVCILTNKINSQTDIFYIQQLLLRKFNVEYKPSDINFHMKLIQLESDKSDSSVLDSEDYFEGF